jgi:hypothetical protein
MYFCDRKSFWVGVQWPSSKWATFLGIATAVLFCIQHGSAHAVWMAYLRANARATICRDRAVLKVGGSVQGVYSWLVRRETEKRRIICMENQEYVHDELEGDRYIRLLKIERKTPWDEVRCDIIQVSLDCAPSYEALSYTWGSGILSHSITIRSRSCEEKCGGNYTVPDKTSKSVESQCTRCKVTSNAYCALRSLRSVIQPRLIWIDSICINQRNNPEKNKQILLMRDIYRRASRVIVWLDEGEDSHLAFSLISELLFITKAETMMEIIARYKDEAPSPRWLALNKLVRSPWFDRVWVIQEMVFASKIQVIYGDRKLGWRDLVAALCPIASPVDPAQLCKFVICQTEKHGLLLDSQSLHHVLTMDHLRRRALLGIKPTLFACLEHTMAFKATDPKDFIFAIQAMSLQWEGISQADNDKNPELAVLKPDYSKAVEEIFTDVARYILSTSDMNRLSMLKFAGIGITRSMSASLPTWVPQWGSGDRTNSLTTTGNLKERSTVYDYQTSGITTPEICIDYNSKTLSVGGLLVDEIVNIGVEPPPSFDGDLFTSSGIKASNARLWTWRREAQQLSKAGPSRIYSTEEDRDEAFWRTCMGNRLVTSEGVTRPAPAAYGEYYRSAIKERRIQQLLSIGFWTEYWTEEMAIEREFGSLAGFEECAGQARKYEAAIGPHAYGRRFCMTARGYMSLVPPNSKAGDVVCVLFGSQTPFVLRPESERRSEPMETVDSLGIYTLVGECYVNGMMDGEMLAIGLQRQKFVIC